MRTRLKAWKETLKLRAVLEAPSPLIDSTLVELRPFSFLHKGQCSTMWLSKAFLTRKRLSVTVPFSSVKEKAVQVLKTVFESLEIHCLCCICRSHIFIWRVRSRTSIRACSITYLGRICENRQIEL